ncbi:MAG TPA: hypothetical protein VFV27_09270 [Nevskiaceae bacterium]|nr:hypothetical protein [Nevskiaceae bacterium]
MTGIPDQAAAGATLSDRRACPRCGAAALNRVRHEPWLMSALVQNFLPLASYHCRDCHLKTVQRMRLRRYNLSAFVRALSGWAVLLALMILLLHSGPSLDDYAALLPQDPPALPVVPGESVRSASATSPAVSVVSAVVSVGAADAEEAALPVEPDTGPSPAGTTVPASIPGPPPAETAARAALPEPPPGPATAPLPAAEVLPQTTLRAAEVRWTGSLMEVVLSSDHSPEVPALNSLPGGRGYWLALPGRWRLTPGVRIERRFTRSGLAALRLGVHDDHLRVVLDLRPGSRPPQISRVYQGLRIEVP